VVQKYAHLGQNHLAEYANSAGNLKMIVTKSPQSKKQG
jgi:hypothetical protein